MRIVIDICTDGSAFQDDGNGGRTEIARILCEAARSLDQHDIVNPLRDLNGNTVGKVKCVREKGEV